MRSRSLRNSFLSLVIAAVAVAGCESFEMPGAASDPQYSAARSSSLREVPGKHQLVETTATFRVIGPAGGSLELAGHRLAVPAGAVAHATRFSLRLLDNGFVEVDLQAVRQSADDVEVNVGKRGFAKPVVLQLSYELAEGVSSPDALVIAWVKPDGSLQPLRSTHDAQEKVIIAELDHFSRYILATP